MAKFSNSNCQSTLTDVSLNASNSNNQPTQADSVYTEQQIAYSTDLFLNMIIQTGMTSQVTKLRIEL